MYNLVLVQLFPCFIVPLKTNMNASRPQVYLQHNLWACLASKFSMP